MHSCDAEREAQTTGGHCTDNAGKQAVLYCYRASPSCKIGASEAGWDTIPHGVMAMINRVIIVGNLTRDAEAVSTTTGKPMTRMRLATNSQWKDADGNKQEAAEFHAVVCFGRLAEICSLYASKGRRVYVEGRLRTRNYAGADGVQRYTTEIVAETVKLLQPRLAVTGEAVAAVAVGA
jgi:single-strand DNA-binding protein